MARGFKRKGRGADARYAATLDEFERQLLVGLLTQVVVLLDPSGAVPLRGRGADKDDEFDRIVAGLGDLGAGPKGGGAGDPDPGEARSPTSSVDPDTYATDPAVRRLLPPGHASDDEAAAEYRRLTEHSLRERKVNGLRTATAALESSGDRIVLDQAEALALLIALTDVRLVLASRLGLESDEDAERLHAMAADTDPDDPVAQAAAIYDFLSWLQETLAGCLTP